jgi:hypothetical protein
MTFRPRRIVFAMARDSTNEPDLFPAVKLVASTGPSAAVPGRPSRRTALPTDLPRAMRCLEDREVDRLLRAAIDEAKRRGRPMPLVEHFSTATPASSKPLSKEIRPLGRPTRQRQIRVAAAALTRGQVNAVRAAFKAGVTPSRIARQFGLSQSDVRKALASDDVKR